MYGMEWIILATVPIMMAAMIDAPMADPIPKITPLPKFFQGELELSICLVSSWIFFDK